MFVQIIEGRTSDPEGVKRLGERWEQELRPGATGFLGSTAGVTADGRAITVVRFESPEAAQANSNREEQTAFFNEMVKLFDGEPTFSESTETDEFNGSGDKNTAKFVQVMKTPNVDRDAMREMDEQLNRYASERPDLLGSFRVWTGADSCVELAYFTSEAEARAGESKELSPEMQALMEKFGATMANTEFLDLSDPQIS